jgi:hemerythrin-like domain-containing protein
LSETDTALADTSDMFKVHTMFRREFSLLPDLVRSVDEKDIARAKAVAAHVELVTLLLHHHHCAEDEVLWPRLLDRAPEEIEPVVRLAEGHHQEIEVLHAEAVPLLASWSESAGVQDRQALAAALNRLAVLLHEHMGLEEKLVLPLAARHIYASEWNEMVSSGAASIPRELGPVIAGMLMYEGGLEVVPPPMRELLGELGPRAYAAHSAQVHGIPTPPRSDELGIGTPHVGLIGALARG